MWHKKWFILKPKNGPKCHCIVAIFYELTIECCFMWSSFSNQNSDRYYSNATHCVWLMSRSFLLFSFPQHSNSVRKYITNNLSIISEDWICQVNNLHLLPQNITFPSVQLPLPLFVSVRISRTIVYPPTRHSEWTSLIIYLFSGL